MIDCRRMIDDIQSILYSGGDYPRELLTALATDYLAACENANERLRECQELLRKGLRAEAIQRCEIEPNLLDFVAALDFAERAQWCELLKASKLLVPPELLIEVAADLNSAYAQEQPLTTLMRQHRLYALGRAPLRQRIGTLRKIAAADPDNSIWQDDLKTYERARHQQIQTEQSMAANQRDVSTLTAILDELRSPDWVEPPASNLVQLATRTLFRVKGDRAREQLAALEPKLTAAHANFDVAEARDLRDRWRELASAAGLMPGDALAEMVAPALEWLEHADEREFEQEQYQSARAELEHALDNERPRAELERLFHRLNNFQQDIPEAILMRYHARLESLELAASRKSKLLLAGVIGAVLLIAGITTAAIVQRMRSQERQAVAASMNSLIESGSLDDAVKMLSELKPEMRDDPAIQELAARLQGLQQNESARRAAFKQALDAAEKSGLDQPDRIALDKARDLGKTPSEIAAVDDLEARIRARARENQAARDKRFADATAPLLDKIEKVQAGELFGFQERLDALQDLKEEVSALERQSGVSQPLRENLALAKRKLDTLLRTELEGRRQAAGVDGISSAIGNPTAFAERLAKFADDVRGTQRAADFAQVAKQEATLWTALENWNRFVDTHGSEDLTQLTPADAAARSKATADILAECGNLIDPEPLRAQVEYLDTVAARLDPDTNQPITAALHGPFNHFLVAKLHMVLDNNGKRYYCKEKPAVIDSGTVRFKYLADTDPASRPRFKGLAANEVAEITEAPQSVVSRDAQQAIKALSEGNWEQTFYAIQNGIYNSKNMDPIVKVQLMTVVLEVGCKGSHCLRQAFEPTLNALNSLQIQGLNWVDPNDQPSDEVRAEAQRIIDNDLQMVAARDVLRREYSKLRNPPAQRRYRWIGWLHRDAQGDWQCTLREGSGNATGGLCVVSTVAGAPGDTDESDAKPSTPTGKIESIGSVKQGKVSLNSDVMESMIEGRPVFAVDVPIGSSQ